MAPSGRFTPSERLKILQRRQSIMMVVKWALAIILLLGCGVAFYQLWIKDSFLFETAAPISITPPSRQEVIEKRIINPVYKSFDSQNRPFTLKATSSTEVDDDNVYLQDPSGVYFKNEAEEPLYIRATAGRINKLTNELDLSGSIQLTQGDIIVQAPTFHLDTKNRVGYTHDGVVGQTTGKKIEAGTFEISDQGDTLTFRQGSSPSRPKITLQTN